MSRSTTGHAEAADPVLAELVEEITDRLQAGESVDLEAYAARAPGRVDELRRLLPALEMLAAAGGSRDGPGPAAKEVEDGAPVRGVLGDFRILREVGRGGMGVVYEAEQISLGRRVALKVLPFAATMDPRQLQRFRNEAQAAACLHHPGIVPVHFVGCERDVHFYAMQFIEGRTVAAVIDGLRRQEGVAPAGSSPRDRDYFRTVVRWGCEAAEALDHAHQVGVVHRDVKPANLLVDDAAGKVWVTDFGLARFGQGDGGLTLTGDLVGTLRYMSPEQALAKRVVIDHRTDVYSLGATLYELLTLRPAFGGSDRQELLRQIAFEEPVAPRRLRRTVPRELETVLLKALEKSPADRYATAKELADDLRNFLEDRPIRARRPGPARRMVKWARRHRPLVAAAAVSLLLALAMLAASNLVIWREHEETKAALRKVRLHRTEVDVLAPQLAQLHRESEANLERSLRALDGVLAALDDVPPGPEAERVRRAAAGPALEYYRGFRPPEGGPPPPLRWEMMWAYVRLGSLLALRDDFEGAKQALEKASALAEGLQRLLGTRSGELFPPDLPNRPSAERTYRRALEHWRKAAPDGLWCVPDYRSALANSLPQRRTADPRRAEEAPRPEAVYRPRFELLERAWADNPTPRHQQLLMTLWSEHAWDLRKAGRRQDALAAYRRALDYAEQWREDFPSKVPYLGLAPDLYRLGQRLRDFKAPDAERAFRSCLRLYEYLAGEKLVLVSGQSGFAAGKLDVVRIRLALAEVLGEKGAPDEATAPEREKLLDQAAAECREALRLGKDDRSAHFTLGCVLQERGRLDDAIDEYRQAIQSGGDCRDVYNNLDIALSDRGRLEEAVAVYREAVRLEPHVPLYHTRLGLAWRRLGRFRLAAEELRLGRRWVSDVAPAYAQEWTKFWPGPDSQLPEPGGPDWSYPSAGWARDLERLAECEARLPALVRGEPRPRGAAEQLALALFLQENQKLYAAAARRYGEAFAAEPALAEDPTCGHRYAAAAAAARAGCGQGKDAAGLDEPRRAALRRLALAWLRAELAAWRRLLEARPNEARSVVDRTMRFWLRDRDFAEVQRPAPLARLPEAERRDWEALWVEVEALGRYPSSREP